MANVETSLSFLGAIKTIWRVLTFRATYEELTRHSVMMCIIGMGITMAVGIGRYWDDPRQLEMGKVMGFGSLAYAFLFAFTLFLLLLPFGRKIRYIDSLAFVTATAAPGIVYAMPIEVMVSDDLSYRYNLVALLFVSAYRVALFVWFLKKVCDLTIPQTVVTTLLPLSTIVAGLMISNRMVLILDVMGGFRGATEPTRIEETLQAIGSLALIFSPTMVALYIALILIKYKKAVFDDP